MMYQQYDKVVYIGESNGNLTNGKTYRVDEVSLKQRNITVNYRRYEQNQFIPEDDYIKGVREYTETVYPGIDSLCARFHERVMKQFPGDNGIGGTVNYAIAVGTKGVPTDDWMVLGGACFGNLNRWSNNWLDEAKGQEVLAIAVDVAKYLTLMSDKRKKEYIEWLTYLMTDSPWKDAYIPKPVSEIIKDGVLLDVDKSYDYIIGAAIMLRSGWEHQHVAPNFSRLVALGAHPRIAQIIARFTPGNKLITWSGHELLNNTTMSFTDYRNFFRDDKHSTSEPKGSYKQMSFRRHWALDDVIHGRGKPDGLRRGDDGMVQITLNHFRNEHPECVEDKAGWRESTAYYVTTKTDEQAKVLIKYWTDIIMGDGPIPLKAEVLKATAKKKAEIEPMWITHTGNEMPKNLDGIRVYCKLIGPAQPRSAGLANLWRWELSGSSGDIIAWRYATDEDGWIESKLRRPLIPLHTVVEVRMEDRRVLGTRAVRNWTWGKTGAPQIHSWRYAK